MTIDMISFNAAISACEKAGQWERVLSMLSELKKSGTTPSALSFNVAVSACQKDGQWERGLAFLSELREASMTPDVMGFNAAILASDRGGQWELTLLFLSELQEAGMAPTMASLKVALSASDVGSQWKRALSVLRELQGAGMSPDLMSFSKAISACEKNRKWERALSLLNELQEAGVTLDMSRFNATVAACDRAYCIDGPYFQESGHYYYDTILNKTVGSYPPVDDYKLELLRSFSHLRKVRSSPVLTPIQPLVPGTRPTVMLLTSGKPQTVENYCRTSMMFHRLGFDCIKVMGHRFDDKSTMPEGAKLPKGRRGLLAWMLCFLPKLAALTEKLDDNEYILIAEDSCWPTTDCTPELVSNLTRKFGNLWLGYRRPHPLPKTKKCPPPKTKQVDMKIDPDGHVKKTGFRDAWIPYGLKLMVLSHEAIILLYRAFTQLSTDWCAEEFFNMLVANPPSDQVKVTVKRPALAGSQAHYSLVDGQWQQASYPREIAHRLMPLNVFDTAVV